MDDSQVKLNTPQEENSLEDSTKNEVPSTSSDQAQDSSMNSENEAPTKNDTSKSEQDSAKTEEATNADGDLHVDKTVQDGAEPNTKDLKNESEEVANTSQAASEGAACSSQMEVEGAACSSPGKGATNDSQMPIQSVYHVKWINFKGQHVGIITQNENGPCPLLAIMNILLLQGKVKLPGMLEIVSSGQLMEYLGDCIFEHAPKNINEDSRLDYEQNMSDAMAVFHKLQTGLDVNVKFSGVTDFEYTPECIVFDLLNIKLLHGWLVDPQNTAEVNAVGHCSYNQLVEKIITQKNSTTESQVTEALVAEDFLNKTSHQLTYHGLCMLASHFKDSELAVLFRNNHFSTLLKHRDELLVLVTDQGFLTESNVVWETLSNVEGDCHFVDAEFRTYRKPEPSSSPVTVSEAAGSPEQVDQDYLVALSLQQESQEQAPTETLNISAGLSEWELDIENGSITMGGHELAMKLQDEEDRQMALMQQQQTQQQRRQQQAARNQQHLSEQYMQAQQERKKNESCTLL